LQAQTGVRWLDEGEWLAERQWREDGEPRGGQWPERASNGPAGSDRRTDRRWAGAPAAAFHVPEERLPDWCRQWLRQTPDRLVRLAVAAAVQAFDDADLAWPVSDGERVGCVVGTSKGSLRAFQRLWPERRAATRRAEVAAEVAACSNAWSSSQRARASLGPTVVGSLDGSPESVAESELRGDARPSAAASTAGQSEDDASGAGRPHRWSDWFSVWPNAAASVVAGLVGAEAAALAPVAACATGLTSLAWGVELIRRGVCDVVVAGSADASLHEPLLSSYRRMGVLAQRFDQPQRAVRPFDRRRCGFLVGEGAAVLVLERWERAVRRGARIYAEWLEHAWGSDPADFTSLSPQGQPLAELIRRLLKRSGLSGQPPAYVNFHGTATEQNDAYEVQAVRRAFGPSVRATCGSGIKGSVGHLLGAAGSVELAVTALSLHHQTVPPTVNLVEPDPQCRLDLVRDQARSFRFDHALKLSLGFGGHLVAALLRRADVAEA